MLCCVLFLNLEASFNFHLTFLQLNVLNMFTCFFPLLPAIFFELSITRTFFRFPLKVRVIGSRLYEENPGGGREGGVDYSTNFYPGRLRPKVQPHTLLYTTRSRLQSCTIFHEKRNPFRIPYKWYPFHFPWLELCIPFNCCK